MFRKYVFLSIILLLILLTIPLSGYTQENTYQIGIVIDGPWDHNEAILSLFKQEILDITEGEFIIEFPEEKTIVCDWTSQSVGAALDQLWSDPEVDLVLGMGLQASNYALLAEYRPKPTMAPFIQETLVTGRQTENGGSGVQNLVYSVAPALFQRDLDFFRDIVPFTDFAFLMQESYCQNKVGFEEHLAEYLEGSGLTAHVIPVSTSAQAALDSIPETAEAVYLGPLLSLTDEQYSQLVDGLIAHRLPSFSAFGRMDVERGIMAGLETENMFDRRARTLALRVQQILLGEAPANIPVAISTEQRLTINMETAREIGISPRWEIINEADVINDVRQDVARRLTLSGVIREAIQVNPELQAKRTEVIAARQDVNEARANLLPQIEASALYAQIDDDRAENSMGQAVERTITGNLTVTQLLFSEPAWANLSMQQHMQRARMNELRAMTLDVARDASVAYLNVLMGKASERIQKENLRLSRENLDLARVRETIGVAGPAEVYRWEAQISQSRNDVIQANAQRNLAEMQLNRILHRPTEETFELEDLDMESQSLLLSIAPPFLYIENRQNFRLLRDFVVQETMNNSPELAQLDEIIATCERFLASQGRQYYTPTLALQAGLENTFDRQGAGLSTYDALPSKADDLNWNVGIQLSIPLFEGGSRFASHRRARFTLQMYQQQRGAVAEQLEQRVRSALHSAGASYASIRHTREAADAARRTFEVVSDSYASGMVSILELLDAQNAALVTEEAAAVAVYEFILDYLNVLRASGSMLDGRTPGELQALSERLERFIVENGGYLPAELH